MGIAWKLYERKKSAREGYTKGGKWREVAVVVSTVDELGGSR